MFTPCFTRLVSSACLLLSLTACGTKEPSQTSALAQSEGSSRQTDVIVQLFNWPFEQISREIPELAKLGYAQVHVSPPNLTIASTQWWGRYQPVDYRMIAGPLGNEKQFRNMIDTAHRYNIRIIVDIVFNHTANPSSPLPPEAKELVEKEGPLFFPSDYHQDSCTNDWNNTAQVRNGRLCGASGDLGLPDLDQGSKNVLKVQQDFLKRLNAMGVDGYRLDAIKHMEPSYFQKLLTPEISKGKFIFGEIIADAGRYDEDLKPYLDNTDMSLYDFPLRATIQGAFCQSGSLATLVDANLNGNRQTLPWNKGVSFVVNHDIPNNEGFRSWILDKKDEELAYTYLLGRSEGVPYIFSDLGKDSRTGLTDDRWKNAHRDPKLAHMIAFHNAVHGQTQDVRYASDCAIVVQRGGKGFFAINKCGDEQVLPLSNLHSARYGDVLGETELEVHDGQLELRIPGRSSQMFLVKH